MRISLAWLERYVPLPSAEELARRLTAVGLEVEGIERIGAALDGVVAARIVSSARHPNAERLSVCQVEAGAGPQQVVCGATNWQVGDVVPLATPGTRMPAGHRIDRASLRGVDSQGMLCSAKELALSEDAAGLLILPPDTVPGTPIARALGIEDVVFEVNVTPNRADALSHLGIAREVAAATGATLRIPDPGMAEQAPSASASLKVTVEAPERCFRYAGRVIDGVTIGPSPRWLAQRLEACGVRSISNVVDATNFVLLEYGQPLHAFDLEKVAGREIVVRMARPGEKMTTLDGVERTLSPDDLVIADRDRASALAGVMGGGDSEISAGTTRVLLESAWFEPTGVRRTAKRHGLHTEASHRFERGVDPEGVGAALDRCAALIAELSGGVVRRGAVDVKARKRKPIDVELPWVRPGQVLGMPVSREQARTALEALGFEVRKAGPRKGVFRVPSWRLDVSREEDLIEEIVRLGGYDAIPETLPAILADTPAPSREAVVTGRVREALEAGGFSEAVNFSFVAPGDLVPLASGEVRPGIPLKNPISADLAVMRSSLVPSLLKGLAYNRRQRVEDVRLYEIACTYHPRDAGALDDAPAREELRVAGVASGRRHPVGWSSGGEPVDFHDLKGALEALLETLGIEGVRWVPGGASWLHPRSAATLSWAGPEGSVSLGVAGEVHPRVAGAFDLPRGVFVFDLSFAALLAAARLVRGHADVARFPAVLRDLAVVVANAVPAQAVLDGVRAEPLVEDVTLFDVYRGPPIPEGKKNLAMAIRYRAADRTLTDGEADAAHTRIVERLRGELEAELRG